MEHAIQINQFLVRYSRTLVADIGDERMAEQPQAGINHPAWVLGHLGLTAGRGLALLGVPETLPKGWTTLFGRGSKPTNSRAGYPSKDELLQAIERGYQQLREMAVGASPEKLSQPNPNPMLKEALPTVGGLITFLLTGHVGLHLGQLSMWRRLIGLPPLF
jgi:hypothetical protein